MESRTRREFLGNVGKGMLVAGLGTGLAETLGVATPAAAEAGADTLTFGSLEPLVALIQETAPDALMPALVQRLRTGTELREVVAAGALANARAFGGEDYIGFHTFMALAPSYTMARELPSERRALPVLKVMYRNAAQIQTKGGRSTEVLRPCHGDAPGGDPGQALREGMHTRDMAATEQRFAGLVEQSAREAFDALQTLVQEELDVHRVVLSYRAWGMLEITGKEHAHTLLRQSIRYCVRAEQQRATHKLPEPAIRRLIPKVLDDHRLLDRKPASREVDDAWVDRLARTILSGPSAQAADAVGAALAEGVSHEDIGEALILAANQQVLRDPGRPAQWAQPGKPVGSVHGDSPGVHASDSVNAWRNIASVSNHRNSLVSLIAAAAHVAQGQGVKMADLVPYPWMEHTLRVQGQDQRSLLAEADAAIRAGDQGRACAVVQAYGDLGHAARPMFDLMLRYATSEDGSLHAEKYYRTVREEFARARKAFRWRHLVGLARVTASEYGRPAPGYADACRLLKVGSEV